MEDLKKFQDELEQSQPRFNGGECKVACNCIEIAEYKAGQQGVKSYPCLGDSKLDHLESFTPPNSKADEEFVEKHLGNIKELTSKYAESYAQSQRQARCQSQTKGQSQRIK